MGGRNKRYRKPKADEARTERIPKELPPAEPAPDDSQKQLITLGLGLTDITSQFSSEKYIITASLIAEKILLDVLNKPINLSWSRELEQVVRSLKICIYASDMMAQRKVYCPPNRRAAATTSPATPAGGVGRVESGDNPFPGREPHLVLAHNSLDALIKICEFLDGASAFNFYSTILLSDDPPKFHFLDLIKPRRIFETTRILNFFQIVEFVETAFLSCRSIFLTLEKKVLAKSEGDSYVPFSQGMADFVDEFLVTLLELCDLPGQVDMKVNDVLLNVLEALPINKLNERMTKKVNQYLVSRLESQPPLHVSRIVLLRVATDVIGYPSPAANDLAYHLLFTQTLRPTAVPSAFIQKFISHFQYLTLSFSMGSDDIYDRSRSAIQELKMLQVFASNYFELFKCLGSCCFAVILNLFDIFEVYEDRLTTDEEQEIAQFGRVFDKPSIFRQSLKFIETFLIAMNKSMEEDLEGSAFYDGFLHHWDQFVSLAPILMSCRDIFVSKAYVDCYGAIGKNIFSLMSESYKIHLCTSLLGYARSHERDIRDKACRGLAHYLNFGDVLPVAEKFLMDTFEIVEYNIRHDKAEIRQLQFNYGWALANVAEYICDHYEDTAPSGYDTYSLFQRLIGLGDICMSDYKTRCNGCRTVGLALHWAPSVCFTNPNMSSLVSKNIQNLIKFVGHGRDYKTRWNASYGLGCVLLNSALLRELGSSVVMRILDISSAIARTSESFKERLQCLAVITKIKSRDLYGQMFYTCWSRVFNLVEDPNIDEGTELKHKIDVEKFKEDLTHKAGHCVTHFTSLMSFEDLLKLDDINTQYADILSNLVRKYRSEVTNSEQQQELENAREVVRHLAHRTCESSQDIPSIAILSDAFLTEF